MPTWRSSDDRGDLAMNLEQYSEHAIRVAEDLIYQIGPLFIDQPPEIVSVVLAELLAKLLAGDAPQLRDPTFAEWVAMVAELIPGEVDAMIAAGLVGEEWRVTQ